MPHLKSFPGFIWLFALVGTVVGVSYGYKPLNLSYHVYSANSSWDRSAKSTTALARYEAWNELTQVMQSAPNESARRNAVDALAESYLWPKMYSEWSIDQKIVESILKTACSDPSPKVREAALNVLFQTSRCFTPKAGASEEECENFALLEKNHRILGELLIRNISSDQLQALLGSLSSSKEHGTARGATGVYVREIVAWLADTDSKGSLRQYVQHYLDQRAGSQANRSSPHIEFLRKKFAQKNSATQPLNYTAL
jgi:hypothetical protein